MFVNIYLKFWRAVESSNQANINLANVQILIDFVMEKVDFDKSVKKY